MVSVQMIHYLLIANHLGDVTISTIVSLDAEIPRNRFNGEHPALKLRLRTLADCAQSVPRLHEITVGVIS